MIEFLIYLGIGVGYPTKLFKMRFLICQLFDA